MRQARQTVGVQKNPQARQLRRSVFVIGQVKNLSIRYLTDAKGWCIMAALLVQTGFSGYSFNRVVQKLQFLNNNR
jgi:hypothetical protein